MEETNSYNLLLVLLTLPLLAWIAVSHHDLKEEAQRVLVDHRPPSSQLQLKAQAHTPLFSHLPQWRQGGL